VGALEDGEEDEDNVYGVETLTSYDSALAHEGEITMERKFGWTGTQQTGKLIWAFILPSPSLSIPNPPILCPDEWGLSSFKRASKQTINTRVSTTP
jgi:hypothetical protein